jgi:hypothetical protein
MAALIRSKGECPTAKTVFVPTVVSAQAAPDVPAPPAAQASMVIELGHDRRIIVDATALARALGILERRGFRSQGSGPLRPRLASASLPQKRKD